MIKELIIITTFNLTLAIIIFCAIKNSIFNVKDFSLNANLVLHVLKKYFLLVFHKLKKYFQLLFHKFTRYFQLAVVCS